MSAVTKIVPALEFSGPYPTDKLVGCESALILFSAAFGGMNDAAWIADAGFTAMCVDLDGEKLEEMRPSYPEYWTFERADAYLFASDAHDKGLKWDVVSLDPYTNEFTRCADNIEAWCRLAKHIVIIGTGTQTIVHEPAGWTISQRIKRSTYAGGVWWTVLERA